MIKEPLYKHGQAPTTGILIVNLGTPTAPTAAAVRPYLKTFLSDRRVVEVPRLIWWFILHGVILPFRSKQSAKKYASIWTDQGSPLQVNTHNQFLALEKIFAEKYPHKNIKVAYAMRYSEPSIEKTLAAMKKEHLQELIILPLYPQYCSSTSGSILENIFKILNTWRVMPTIRTINRYHDNMHYINALKTQTEAHWQKVGRPDFANGDKLLMSFHGIPERSLWLGDYYHCECYKTARLLANALGLHKDYYQLSFQSRLGRAKWLQPYTEPTLEKLAKHKNRVDLICPGFASDCLETLEEIAMEGKETFISHGGKQFEYIPCLNDSSAGMNAILAIIEEHMHGFANTDKKSEQLNITTEQYEIVRGK
jgi:protoporphyrin/coproporphyrin ferrochelatase